MCWKDAKIWTQNKTPLVEPVEGSYDNYEVVAEFLSEAFRDWREDSAD